MSVRKRSHYQLGLRERQVMEIVYRLGEASVREVIKELPGEPNYSAVRGVLNVLMEKGHAKSHQVGTKYVYSPTISKAEVRHSEMQHVMASFFDNSTEEAVAELLNITGKRLTKAELKKIADLLDNVEISE